MANVVTHVATIERRDVVLTMLEEAALLLRRHWAADSGCCNNGMVELLMRRLGSFLTGVASSLYFC